MAWVVAVYLSAPLGPVKVAAVSDRSGGTLMRPTGKVANAAFVL